MKTHARKKTWVLVLVLALILPLCMPQALAGGAEPVRLEDDFYSYVNAQWLAEAEIRPDRSRISAFSEMGDNILDTLMADFEAMMASGQDTGDPMLDMFLTYYSMVKDMDKRNADGFAPAAEDYARIQNLKSLEDLSAQIQQWQQDGMPLPFIFGVSTDPVDVTRYILGVGMGEIYLDDPDYYNPDNPAGQKAMSQTKEMQTRLLMAAGATEEEARADVERAFAFDALLVAQTPSLEEQANYVSRLNNPVPYEEFAALSKNVDLGALAAGIVGQAPDTINMMNAEFFHAFDEIYAPEHFENLKSWMKVNFLREAAPLLGDDFLEPLNTYQMQSTGMKEKEDPREDAYHQAHAAFDDFVGMYYGKTYFGEEAKAEVTAIVKQALDVYRTRLENNDWLSEETKAMAIRKLDAMTLRVGYPDKLPSYYDLYTITPAQEGGTLYSNARARGRAFRQEIFGRYGTKPDRTDWIVGGDTVNAFYSPTDNSINFPAGILQPPVYSPTQSQSATLGGIGVVIGHEVSHAFDNNGSMFDEVGNMRDWWTDEDREEFDRRAEAMVELFDGRLYAGSPINGQMTLGENIADAGGVSCMLTLAQSLEDVSYRDFFEAFAAIWRNKTTPETDQMMLMDVHSPPILRVNIQCGNADEFYEAYDIKETDGMYIAPEARVKIW
ncbi:MAG: M13 family metallopeptidase [Candidatus Limiplasma sp.]|nr:M13 family metallopeptidase [Candidatus Limiplasma sp.]